MAPRDLFREREMTVHPYQAPAARVAALREGVRQVTQGMSAETVQSILGDPDEVRPRYEARVKHPRPVGHTYTYLLQRLRATGSEAERQEVLIRVSFDREGRVTEVETPNET